MYASEWVYVPQEAKAVFIWNRAERKCTNIMLVFAALQEVMHSLAETSLEDARKTHHYGGLLYQGIQLYKDNKVGGSCPTGSDVIGGWHKGLARLGIMNEFWVLFYIKEDLEDIQRYQFGGSSPKGSYAKPHREVIGLYKNKNRPLMGT